MGILPVVTRVRLSILVAVLVGLFAVPSLASASECTLPATPADASLNGTPQEFKGNFGPELNGKFIQIPFDVPAGTTGMRISYCYDEATPGNPAAINNTTLDLGVYEPNAADPENWTMAQRRGWSGSAVKIVGIGENGPTSPSVYNDTTADTIPGQFKLRKAYVSGSTTRAYKPGPMPEGKWAVELGAGYIDPALVAGADWKVEVVTSTDASWSNQNFTPQPYTPYVANAAAGWYKGDFHAHGENEPGNALMKDTFDLGFGPEGLDFITLVDHNNDVAKTSELGEYKALYPGKLIIPGTEMTTYDGHFNSHNSSVFTDFRLSDIYRWDDTANTGILDPGELTPVRGPEDPSSRFAQIRANGGIAQINHPAIFKTAPAVCRGCAWTYSDERTDFSKVSSIELQTGTAGIPYAAPAAMNPFTADTIDYYEHALATGNHIAAVGSSDDHKAGGANGPFDAPVGHASTSVYANELSPSGITDAVNAGHTFVRFFGADGPGIEMKAGEPGKADLTAIPGDSASGPSLNIQFHVTKAGPTATRPGAYTIEILRNGVSVHLEAITSDDFYGTYQPTESGRYSFKLTRETDGVTYIEDYSTPIWLTKTAESCENTPSLCPVEKPPNNFKFKGVKLNKKKGTARIKVRFPWTGRAILTGPGVKKVNVKIKKKNSIVGLNIKPKSKLKKKLKKRGSAKVKVKVKFTPNGGKARTKSKTIKLKLKKKSKKR